MSSSVRWSLLFASLLAQSAAESVTSNAYSDAACSTADADSTLTRTVTQTGYPDCCWTWRDSTGSTITSRKFQCGGGLNSASKMMLSYSGSTCSGTVVGRQSVSNTSDGLFSGSCVQPSGDTYYRQLTSPLACYTSLSCSADYSGISQCEIIDYYDSECSSPLPDADQSGVKLANVNSNTECYQMLGSDGTASTFSLSCSPPYVTMKSYSESQCSGSQVGSTVNLGDELDELYQGKCVYRSSLNLYQKFKTCDKLPNYPGPCASTTRANSFGLVVATISTTTTTTTTSTDGGGMPWWAWLLLVCLCCSCCVFCIGMTMAGRARSTKTSHDRDERPLLPMATATPQTATHFQTGTQFTTVPQSFATGTHQTFAPQRPTFTTNPTPY